MTIDERLEKLTSVVEAHSRHIGTGHDTQLKELIRLASIRDQQIDKPLDAGDKLKVALDELKDQMDQTDLRWQAYINKLPKR
jgi:hypothetical protein